MLKNYSKRVLASVIMKSFTTTRCLSSLDSDCLFTLTDVEEFSKLSGDFNPVHSDQQAALNTRFNKPIVQGMLMISRVSGLIGTAYPGALLLNMNIDFKSHLYVDEVMKLSAVCGTVERSALFLNVCGSKHANSAEQKVVFEGSVKVLLPKNVLRQLRDMPL